MAFESEVDMTPNIDALAEAHYADVDPQNAPSDDDLVEAEWKEERVLSVIENRLRSLFDDLTEDEVEIIKENSDAITDYLYELIEEN